MAKRRRDNEGGVVLVDPMSGPPGDEICNKFITVYWEGDATWSVHHFYDTGKAVCWTGDPH
jgi:hypothetical protein